MEDQLSFQIESSSSSKVKNQQEIKRVKQLKKSAQRSERLDKTKKQVQQQEQLNISKQAIKKASLEQWVSELLTGPKKELKLKALSLEKEVDREKQLSESISLREDSLRIPLQKEEQLFENLISVKTVAEGLGVAPKTVHNWVYLRKIPYVKVGLKVLFRPKSLKAWLNRKEVKSWL